MEENTFPFKEEFEELISQDALIEYAQYVENYYGTPKAYVEKQLEAGRDGDPGNRDPGCCLR